MPPDLKHCPDCGKVMGDHKGWFGPQFFCGREPKPEDALREARWRGRGIQRAYPSRPYQMVHLL